MPERLRRPRFPMLPLALLLAAPALARVDVTLDAPSLNEMLSAMAPKEVRVPLAQGRGVTLQLQDLKVTGFDPTEGQKQEGFVLTTVRLKVPELGLDLPLEPRLSMQVAERNGKKVAFLRFEKVPVQLPITGAVDIAPLLPVLPFPTDTSWTVAAQSGNVRVRTVFLEARMGAKNLRLTFDLEASPAP